MVMGHGKKSSVAAKFQTQTSRSSWVAPLILKGEFRGIVRLELFGVALWWS